MVFDFQGLFLQTTSQISLYIPLAYVHTQGIHANWHISLHLPYKKQPFM